MPAICPPVRPLLDPLAAPPAPAPAVDVPDAVPVIVIVIGLRAEVATIGSATLLQREVVFEKTQHESVLLGELDEQSPHKPPKFDPNPQLLGWFSTACMQLVVKEFAGSAQLVKSARI